MVATPPDEEITRRRCPLGLGPGAVALQAVGSVARLLGILSARGTEEGLYLTARQMSGKPYTVYEVEGRRKRRWVRILLWLFAGLVVVALAVAGGSYLWFRQSGGWGQRPSE